MKFLSVLVLTLGMVMASAPSALSAAEFHDALSLQGYTGLFNTPNAEVTGEGRFDALYSDQIEDRFRSRTDREESYFFSAGFLPFVELGGRLTESPGVMRDLSASVKVKLPFIPRGDYLPDLAWGTQDLGNSSTHFQTRYVVATETWKNLRLSLGYGAGPRRMKGVFGGLEVKATDWLTLIGENDTKETNAGARLITPSLFGYPVRLELTAKTSLNDRPGHFSFGLGIQMPLGAEHQGTRPLPQIARESAPGTPGSDGLNKATIGPEQDKPDLLPAPPERRPEPSPTAPEGEQALSRLAGKLVARGFENVSVGVSAGKVLVVGYENNRYDQSELDGLGMVVGIAVDTVPPGYERFRLVIKKKNLAVLQLEAGFEHFRAFMHDAGALGELNKDLAITSPIDDLPDISYVARRANPSWLTSSLVVYPGLKTYVGTEVGVLDYVLSAKFEYFVNLWKGAVLDTRYNVPVTWTRNFNDGAVFSESRGKEELDRCMLFQTVNPAPEVMLNVGWGRYLPDLIGTLNEITWQPGSGNSRFSFKQASFSTTGNRLTRPRPNTVYIGSYRYFFSPLDLSVETFAGRFFDNDQGCRIELKRFFGDTAFTLYYSDSRSVTDEKVKIGGVTIALPLSFRRDMKPGPVQVRGTDEFSYSQQTKIVKKGSGNYVSASGGVVPQASYNLQRSLYDRDRLNGSYIRTHLLRLRDAYDTYRGTLQ